eukprot:5520592-Alexandrium_andersonii.AAC.1
MRWVTWRTSSLRGPCCAARDAISAAARLIPDVALRALSLVAQSSSWHRGARGAMQQQAPYTASAA